MALTSASVGACVGAPVGVCVGAPVGARVGDFVGGGVGALVGALVGFRVGVGQLLQLVEPPPHSLEGPEGEQNTPTEKTRHFPLLPRTHLRVHHEHELRTVGTIKAAASTNSTCQHELSFIVGTSIWKDFNTDHTRFPPKNRIKVS